MRTNLIGGAILGLMCLSSASFACWDATDKALGHEGKNFNSARVYNSQQRQQAYRAAPVMVAPAVADRAAAPQVAATNSNTARRSFSVEPSTPTVTNNNAVYIAPRSYNYSPRVHHQPNYSQADTKILGHEGR